MRLLLDAHAFLWFIAGFRIRIRETDLLAKRHSSIDWTERVLFVSLRSGELRVLREQYADGGSTSFISLRCA